MSGPKNKNPLLIPFLITLTGLLVVVAVLIWHGFGAGSAPVDGEAKPAPTILTGPAPKPAGIAAAPAPETDENGRLLTDVERHREISAVPSSTGSAPNSPRFTVSNPPQLSDFEISEATREKMTALAGSGIPQAGKISQFKAMLGDDTDPAAQLLAVKHLTRLVSDDEYSALLAGELMKPNQSEVVRLALFQDANSRPRPVSMPVMLDVMANGNHPLSESAGTAIRGFLGDSFVADPEKLRVVLEQRIKVGKTGL